MSRWISAAAKVIKIATHTVVQFSCLPLYHAHHYAMRIQ